MTGVQTCALPICFPVTIEERVREYKEKREERIKSEIIEEMNKIIREKMRKMGYIYEIEERRIDEMIEEINRYENRYKIKEVMMRYIGSIYE